MSSLNRRTFLKRSLLAGGALAAPLIIPASALGRDGAVAPSNRIVMGGIGIGNRGMGVLTSWVLPEKDVQFVATCDARKARRDDVKKRVDAHYGNTDCKVYPELREFLAARPDIDAVLSTTGDRWHAPAAILAMQAGKDVYSEKPATLTVAQGQSLIRAARQYGRVYQAGMQRLSEPNFIVANELLRLGRLGEVKTVHAHLAPWGGVNLRKDWLPEEPLPSKDEVDWDAWLGGCPWRPYNSRYIGGWREHHDFYTSVIGEWGSHTFAQCQVALGLGETSPVFYPFVDNPTADGMTMRFANGVEMVSTQKGWKGSCGVTFFGSEGWVACADGYSRPEVSNPALLSDFATILQNYLVRTGRVASHMRDFLNCVKTRRMTTASNPTVTHRTMSTVHVANIASWLKRDMTWDPVKEEFVNDDEANRLRLRAQREGWQIC